MKSALLSLFAILAQLGPFGLLIVGVLDSSFLFMPLGNDLLMLGLTARNPKLLPIYAAMATVGSVIGCLLIDLISRKGGEEGLGRMLSEKRIQYVKSRIEKKAGWALGVGALLPPPFPFTPIVAGAAAFQYPRKRMMAILAGARMLRFTIIGVLAIFFGKRILKLAEHPAVEYTMIGLLVLFIGGSAMSIYRWVRRSRRVEHRTVVGSATAALAFICLLAPPASAQDTWLDVSLGWTRLKAQGDLQAGPVPVDLRRDLALQDRWTFLGRASFNPGRRHHIIVEGAPFRFTGQNQLTRTIQFAGRTYTITDEVQSEAQLDYVFAGYQYDIIRRSAGHLGVEVGGAYLHGVGTVASVRTGLTGTSEHRIGLPLVGLQFRVYPIPGSGILSITGEGKGMALGGYGHYAQGTITAGAGLGAFRAFGGYFVLDADVHEDRNNVARSGIAPRLSGPIIGIEISLPR